MGEILVYYRADDGAHQFLPVAFYTMVQQFGTGSQLVDSATTLLRKQVYDRSSAMLWLYFLCVGLVMAAILWLYRKLCLNRWES